MPSIEQLQRQRADELEELSGLRRRLSHSSTYFETRNLLTRIRALEDHLSALTAFHQRQVTKTRKISIYGTRKKPQVVAGMSCQMDISIDGLYFSNPAPKITHGKHVWVRLRIEVAQKSPFSTITTVIPERIRCTWVIPRGWTNRDIYGVTGRVEHVVSSPLVVTREFTAPGSGSTKGNFGCFVDPYYKVEDDADQPPVSSPVEVSDAVVFFDAGNYLLYNRSANVLDASVPVTFVDTSARCAPSDITLFYTDGGTYLAVRELRSGPYAGKFFVPGQEGVTIVEEEGAV